MGIYYANLGNIYIIYVTKLNNKSINGMLCIPCYVINYFPKA